jgi:acyl carrier protein
MGVIEKVIELINDVLVKKDIPQVGIDDEMKVDSITFIEIVVSLETSFDFEFDDEKLLLTIFPNTRSLVEYVEWKIVQKNSK